MQTELSENPKLQRTIPQELELIESFPDKVIIFQYLLILIETRRN